MKNHYTKVFLQKQKIQIILKDTIFFKKHAQTLSKLQYNPLYNSNDGNILNKIICRNQMNQLYRSINL